MQWEKKWTAEIALKYFVLTCLLLNKEQVAWSTGFIIPHTLNFANKTPPAHFHCVFARVWELLGLPNSTVCLSSSNREESVWLWGITERITHTSHSHCHYPMKTEKWAKPDSLWQSHTKWNRKLVLHIWKGRTIKQMPPLCKMSLQGFPGQGEGRREGEEGGREGRARDLPEHPPSGMTAVMATAAMWERSSCGQLIIFPFVFFFLQSCSQHSTVSLR